VSTHHVPSTDGVTLALHDLGGDGPPLLFCHPTGFHGMVWAPVAQHLTSWAHCWTVDFRGHGDSTLPDSGNLGWGGMAEDVLAVTLYINASRPDDGRPLLAVGHSMGGAALVLAEQAKPATFTALWLYEPIVFPPMEGIRPANPLAASARRRRAVFPDKDAAYANYAAKPPLGGLAPEALHAYVDYGFRPTADGSGVELKCAPETEAEVFESGPHHSGFARLGEVACPTWVVASGDGAPPARMAGLVADALPQGRLEGFPQLTHFGPMEDPAAVADAITLCFVAFS
jgi:pimeloyl-ACP methyl ester carboxylesterase